MRIQILGVLLLSGIMLGCSGARTTERPPDDRYGHRYEGKAADGRETIVITPAAEASSYIYFPAVFDTVHIRPAPVPIPPTAGIPVEVLIKGAFPDACSELNSVTQSRAGNLVDVDLEMRRPRGMLCASVVRPYRFYLTLDGLYPPGHYSLQINDRFHPMVIRSGAG